MRSLLPLLSLLPVAVAQTPCGDLAEIDRIAQTAMGALSVPGLCVRIDQNGGVVHQRGYGTYQPTTVVPIASATKWISAAILMAMVDQGRCRLDDRVAQYVPSFNRPDKQAITLRHCFTHTSGMPVNHPAIADDTITLAQATDVLATIPMVATPGSEFSYGGVSMHVAGRVCEVVSGRTWAQLVDDLLAVPLGWTSTDFLAFGPTQNPRIAGGARSDLLDYARFVEMLRLRGRFGTTRVLSEAAVDEMFRDQTSGLPIRNTPHPDNAPYGIGTWLERRDPQGRTLMGSGAGAFGFYGWVDREREVGGVFVVLDRYPAAVPFIAAIQDVTFAMLKPRGVTCIGAPSPACAPATFLNGDRVPNAGDGAFALTAAAAPADASGVLAITADARATGWPLLGIVVHLDLLPPPVFVPWAADASGAARLPLPLSGLVAGERAAAQALWLTPAGCGGDLRASHAIGVTVQ